MQVIDKHINKSVIMNLVWAYFLQKCRNDFLEDLKIGKVHV